MIAPGADDARGVFTLGRPDAGQEDRSRPARHLVIAASIVLVARSRIRVRTHPAPVGIGGVTGDVASQRRHRPRFQVALEPNCAFFVGELHNHIDIPRSVARCVRAAAVVVRRKARR